MAYQFEKNHLEQEVVALEASQAAFAAVRADGSVVTWGRGRQGPVPELRRVRSVTATSRAFAAVDAEGDVRCWGDGHFGGDCRSVQVGELLLLPW